MHLTPRACRTPSALTIEKSKVDNREHRYALPSGHLLGKYRVDRYLGSGGFGITYLATDENLDLQLAIKEYLPSDLAIRDADNSVVKTAADEDDFEWGRKRFLDEARSLARFNHPNIVPVQRFFEAQGTSYIVMDYVEGEPVSDLLERRGTLTEVEIRRSVLPLTDGLTAVHGAVLHRCVVGEVPDDATARIIDDRLTPATKATTNNYSGSLLNAIDSALELQMEDRPKDIPAFLLAMCEMDVSPKSPGSRSANMRQDIDSAEGTHGEVEYGDALSALQHSAEMGSPDAQHCLGHLYHDGKGVLRDHAQAAHWFLEAAEQGHADALHRTECGQLTSQARISDTDRLVAIKSASGHIQVGQTPPTHSHSCLSTRFSRWCPRTRAHPIVPEESFEGRMPSLQEAYPGIKRGVPHQRNSKRDRQAALARALLYGYDGPLSHSNEPHALQKEPLLDLLAHLRRLALLHRLRRRLGRRFRSIGPVGRP